jgi:hypothetical protein
MEKEKNAPTEKEEGEEKGKIQVKQHSIRRIFL